MTASPASRQHGRGFWIVTYVFVVTMAFAGVPAPLYVIYAREGGFGPALITVVFAVYAVGVAGSLILGGHLSDQWGRLRVVVAATGLNLLAALVFLASPALPSLLLARLVSGVGIGLLTGAATAHLTELGERARPHRASTLAAVVSTIAGSGCVGVGSLVAGALAEWAPAPLSTPYLLFAIMLTIGVIGLCFVPETSLTTPEPRVGPRSARRPILAVPDTSRSVFAQAAGLAFVSFAMFGFFTSLAPSFVADTLGHRSHLVAGAVAFSIFGAAVIAQLFTARRERPHVLYVALLALSTGLTLVVVAILSTSLATLMVGSLVSGVGAGLGFNNALATVVSLAPAATRGATISSLYLSAYLGTSVPVIGLGVLLGQMPHDAAIIVFAALLHLVVLLTAWSALRNRSLHPASNTV